MTRLRRACREFITVLRAGQTGFSAGHTAAYNAFKAELPVFINEQLADHGSTDHTPALVLAENFPLGQSRPTDQPILSLVGGTQ